MSYIARCWRASALAIIAAALLAGCASTPREIVRRVEVPVAVPCPAQNAPPRPHLPLADLPQDATAAEIARATAASLEALTGYAAALEILLRQPE
jgi:type IV pilus biogenesis protein CpaD/CtpE